MTTKIFVNLPVKDVDTSIEFFKKRFTFNAQFTDETAACMVISDDIYTMLLTEPKSKDKHRVGRRTTHISTETRDSCHRAAGRPSDNRKGE